MINGRIETCRDGSQTIYSDTFGQFYHNPNGAVAESLHVFFETSGIIRALEAHKPVTVLEIGFGTGLNLLLLADLKYATASKSDVFFQSIEAWPLLLSTATELNYKAYLKNPGINNWLMPLFNELQNGHARYEPEPGFRIQVHRGLFETFKSGKEKYAFVFHDPFSPEVNPELWTPSLFRDLNQWCTDDAILTTYCAASKARAAMALAGWFVARAPGALGKREMTIASKSEGAIQGFSRINEQRLSDRFQNHFDA
jgi:tRNA U34 5-methylaminomethyl-2-thiouridine-forming methyltransferase MnmC